MRKKDIKGDLNWFGLPAHERYLIEERKKRFPYHGVYCFCGKQGSGKTLTAVRLVSNIFLDYKDIYLITNVSLLSIIYVI